MSRTAFPAGVPVLTGASTVSHTHAALSRSGSGRLVSDSAYRPGGFCFMDMPAGSMVRLEGPALPASIIKERMTLAVTGR